MGPAVALGLELGRLSAPEATSSARSSTSNSPASVASSAARRWSSGEASAWGIGAFSCGWWDPLDAFTVRSPADRPPDDHLRADPPAGARGRVDPHHPRGGGRVRAARCCCSRGGKDSIVMLRLAEKAFWPAPHPVPGHARRHRATTSPRSSSSATAGSPSSGVRLVVASVQESIDAGRVVEETGPRASRNRLQTDDAARRHRGAPLRRRLRRRPPRRGEGPGQGAGVLASATSSASGTRRTSGPSCGASTTAGTARASTSGCSRCRNWTELDIWQYIADEGIELPVDLLRPRARGRSSATGCCWPSPSSCRRRRRRGGRSRRSVRYRTVGDATCTGAVESAAAHRRGGHRRGRRHPDHRARRHPRRRPRSARPPWKTASGRATSDGRAAALRHRRVGRRRQVAP